MNYLLSYPRSGNTWLRYMVEYFTGKPTIGYTVVEAGSFDKQPLIHKDSTDYILTKRHEWDDNWTTSDKVILIIRNYKEAIIRHECQYTKPTIEIFEADLMCNNKRGDYISPIYYFNKFQGHKLIVYYEDIILNPKAINHVLSFLNFTVTDDKINAFYNEITAHKNNCLNEYRANATSVTQGNNVIFHLNRISKEERIRWDNLIENKYPYLFNKYLSIYKEK